LAAPRIAFIYPNPRRGLVEAVARGEAPDSTLLGQNHLHEHGLDARVHDPVLARERTSRLRWYLREVVLPWELRAHDVACTPLAGLFPLAARLRERPKVVVVNFGLNLILQRAAPARRRLVAASLRAAARVVCLGESQRTELIELAALDARHVVTVLLGIDASFFAPSETRADDPPLVLAVGKDLARDYATLVEALRDLDVQAHLAVYPRNLEGIDLPANVEARVVGPVELRELYGRAACVVIPQRRDGYVYGSEGGGLTALLEAMAMAKPVVASERAILADYVADGETAVIVPPEDPQALREAIARVLAG
jgi:glycosyltransferase involved in cell wall biosynthesis